MRVVGARLDQFLRLALETPRAGRRPPEAAPTVIPSADVVTGEGPLPSQGPLRPSRRECQPTLPLIHRSSTRPSGEGLVSLGVLLNPLEVTMLQP